MSLSVIVRALADAGATPAMLVAAIQAHEEEAQAIAAGRRARDAARKRAVRQAFRSDEVEDAPGEVGEEAGDDAPDEAADAADGGDVRGTGGMSAMSVGQDGTSADAADPSLPPSPSPKPLSTSTNPSRLPPIVPRKRQSKRARTASAEVPDRATFELVWTTYPHFRGRSSKPKALVEWARLDAATRTAIPQAAARYRAEGREPKMDCGAKALELWLRDARYLDWLPAAPPDPAAGFAPAGFAPALGRPPLGPTATAAAYRWPGPADLHEAIIATRGEAFATSYLDPSDWRDEDRTILTRTDLAAERLNGEARGVLKAFGARAEKGRAG